MLGIKLPERAPLAIRCVFLLVRGRTIPEFRLPPFAPSRSMSRPSDKTLEARPGCWGVHIGLCE